MQVQQQELHRVEQGRQEIVQKIAENRIDQEVWEAAAAGVVD